MILPVIDVKFSFTVGGTFAALCVGWRIGTILMDLRDSAKVFMEQHATMWDWYCMENGIRTQDGRHMFFGTPRGRQALLQALREHRRKQREKHFEEVEKIKRGENGLD